MILQPPESTGTYTLFPYTTLYRAVEASGGGAARRADREGPLDPVDEVALEERLAGPHPVLVAHHRVDLAVVGDQAIRVRERPRREGVGGEADRKSTRLNSSH